MQSPERKCEMTQLQSALLTIVNYLPPILIAVHVYRKMKARYKRPLHKGTDPRVYIITFFAGALSLLFVTLALYLLIAAFYAV